MLVSSGQIADSDGAWDALQERRNGGSMPDAAEEISRAAVVTHATTVGHSLAHDGVPSAGSNRDFAG